jgi:hypothetical protein
MSPWNPQTRTIPNCYTTMYDFRKNELTTSPRFTVHITVVGNQVKKIEVDENDKTQLDEYFNSVEPCTYVIYTPKNFNAVGCTPVQIIIRKPTQCNEVILKVFTDNHKQLDVWY